MPTKNTNKNEPTSDGDEDERKNVMIYEWSWNFVHREIVFHFSVYFSSDSLISSSLLVFFVVISIAKIYTNIIFWL